MEACDWRQLQKEGGEKYKGKEEKEREKGEKGRCLFFRFFLYGIFCSLFSCCCEKYVASYRQDFSSPTYVIICSL